MTDNPKRTSLKQRLKHCEYQRQCYVELHQGEFTRVNKLEKRIRRLKKSQRASILPFRRVIHLDD